ncbi:MAG: alanine racemase [Armatimonadota bacterium]
MPPSTYVAVDTDALAHNLTCVRTRLADDVKLMAVVKANAYGHDTVLAAEAFASAGADWFGVSTPHDAIALRQAGLTQPVLVFLPVLPEELPEMIATGITATVASVENVVECAEAADEAQKAVNVHCYVDTGLGRIGSDDALPDIIDACVRYPRVNLTGVYTHFGPRGSGALLGGIDALRPGASARAFARLASDAIASAGAGRVLRHCVASSMYLQEPKSHLDMVRIGTLLYGQGPADVDELPFDLRKTFELRTHIIATITLPARSPVGYGGDFITRRETTVATLPVGLADGVGVLPESLTGGLRYAVKQYLKRRAAAAGRTTHGPRARIDGTEVPIIGRISMDQCCLDITDIEAGVGTEVALEPRRTTTSPAIPRIAATIETIEEKAEE